MEVGGQGRSLNFGLGAFMIFRFFGVFCILLFGGFLGSVHSLGNTYFRLYILGEAAGGTVTEDSLLAFRFWW
jgi:hypothetical protein